MQDNGIITMQDGTVISRRLTGMDAAIDTFILSLDAKNTTKATYRKSMLLYAGWITETRRDLNSMTRADILAYKDHLLKSGHSVLTVNLYLAALRKFYKWTKEERIYPDIASDVASVKTNKKTFRKMHLESDQGAALLDEVATPKVVVGRGETLTRKLNVNEQLIAKRDFAMVNLMLRTGLRTIEVSRADIGDITVRRGKRILKVWGKGRSEKDSFVVLTDESYLPILEYLKWRPGAVPDEPLFACEGLDSKGRRMSTRRIQAICKEALRAIGLDGHEYSAHSLRHTTGTQILLNGGTMFDVQNVLRHATPATSQIYVDTIMEDKRLDDASEELLDNSFKKESSEEDSPVKGIAKMNGHSR